MYFDIEASFNSLLMHATSVKLDLKISLFALMFDFCFARLASKKATSCFYFAISCSCSSRNKLYSTFFFKKSVDVLNNIDQAIPVVVGAGHIQLIGSITKLKFECNVLHVSSFFACSNIHAILSPRIKFIINARLS